MRILFLFLDGVGLGSNDPAVNPFAVANTPYLDELLGGARLVADSLSGGPLHTPQASLFELDARLATPGMPQSASGQASLLSGINVPAMLGYHYGPKPNPEIKAILQSKNLFQAVQNSGLRSALLNAFPPSYFRGIESGLRIPGAIAMAARLAGLQLRDLAALTSGEALAADFTGRAYRDHLNIPNVPLLTPWQAGQRLATLMEDLDFAMFEYWLSDVSGHRRDMPAACQQIDTIDGVIGGLIECWDFQKGLVLVSSDHGNLEDLSTRRHTLNAVPALLIGPAKLRQEFGLKFTTLTDIAPAIAFWLGLNDFSEPLLI